MSPSLGSCLLTVMAGAASLVPISDVACARSGFRESRPPNHDGVYSVQIITEKGRCDKSYLWTIAIADGQVASTGSTPLEAFGRIDPRGGVTLAFRGFNEVAHVVGRITGRQGSGTWSSPTMACAGTWRALRQS
jgi:hypothetical protein